MLLLLCGILDNVTTVQYDALPDLPALPLLSTVKLFLCMNNVLHSAILLLFTTCLQVQGQNIAANDPVHHLTALTTTQRPTTMRLFAAWAELHQVPGLNVMLGFG